MDLKEEMLKSERVYEGRIFSVERDLVRLPDGTESQRDIVRHPNAVAILAWADREHILLVRQFRYATGRELWEVPAGKLEAGELPSDCAARELQEETGYAPGSLRELAAFYTSPGFSSEMLYLFEARDLVRAAGGKDADEFLEVARLPLHQALAWLEKGKIQDAKTLIALLLAAKGKSA